MSLYKVVLLIDDDKEDQEIFADAVREVDSSIEFLSEYNSEQALRNLGDKPDRHPGIIFLDMNMPRMNGKQLLKELKSDNRVIHIPVVMCSTFFGEQDIEEIRKLGAVDHMVKPTKFDDLCGAIKTILLKKW